MIRCCKWSSGKRIVYATLAFLLVVLTSCSQPSAPSAARTDAPAPVTTDAAKTAPAREAKDARPVKMRVAYSALTGASAPLWIAMEKGLFGKYGVDAEFEFIQGSSTITQGLVAGEIALAYAGAGPSISSGLAGSDLVLVASGLNTLVLSVYAQPSIMKVEDLKGKTMSVGNIGGSPNFAARYTLKKFGLQPEKDVTLLQAGGPPERLAALQSGAVQAAVIGPPATLKARQSGLRELVNVADLGIPYVQFSLATSRKYLANNQETVRNFLKAFVEGISLAKSDKALTMKVIGEYTKTEDKEMLEETYNAFVPKVLPIIPYVSVEGVQSALDELVGENPKAKEAKPEAFVDNRLVKELDESGFIKRLYGN